MKPLFLSRSPVKTARDVLLVRVDRDRFLGVSCDALGGIGSKPYDSVGATPRLVGKMTARVALMELLAIGAQPTAIIGTFSVEPHPTANLIIAGIREEVRSSRLRNIRTLYSSEKNVEVKQTGVGISAFGFVAASAMKIGRCRQNDDVVAVGEPHVGREVIRAEKRRTVADTRDVIRLREQSFVHELIPVGSKGILYEARTMAKDSHLSFKPSRSLGVDLKKSAGPATVLLCAVQRGSCVDMTRIVRAKPIRVIGEFTEI